MCNLNNQLSFPFDVGAIDRILPSEDDFDAIRDTQTVGDGAQSVSFFQGSPSSEVLADYADNPLPGKYGRDIIGLKVDPTALVIRSTDLTAIDPDKIVNALQGALIKVTGNNGKDTLLRAPLRKFMNLHGIEVDRSENSGATEFYHTATLQPSEDYVKLDRAFQIAANQDFKVEVIFEQGDGAAFGAEADYDLKAFGLAVDMKAVVPYSES